MNSQPGVFEVKVYDTTAERWLMANLKCTCGGDWGGSGSQRLVDVDGRPCDEVDATCAACGTPMTFRFDVSAFFGHKASVDAWIATTLPDVDERTRGKVARKLGPPFMTRCMSFIQGLAKDGDRVTLLYMHSRIAAALESMATAGPESADADGNR